MAMRILISIVVRLYSMAVLLAAPFNGKARLWINGRKRLLERIADAVANDDHPVWIHSASLGEYEQARPIIEKIRKERPNTKILATFFSPSGYEIRKNDPLPDYVFYLPIDTVRNARRFLRIVRPSMAIFVKYEFWYNYMIELTDNSIPFYYVSAIFRPNQYFFKPYGRWFVTRLRGASRIFVQNDESAQLLAGVGIRQVEVCGDTRFDRVAAIAQQSAPVEMAENFKKHSKLIVAGSTWGPDEALLAQLLPKLNGYKLLVAPHEISRKEEVMRTFSDFKTIAYSEIQNQELGEYDVLVVDTIGLLNKLYKYSTLSYVGGAFKTGLHNILEAAVYGVPLFFGPKYSHFNEAVMLVQKGGAFPVNNAGEMWQVVQRFEDNPEAYARVCAVCREYVAANVGACERIYQQIFECV
ncbi:MAG: 3-deoxy-D-manno-octulosonic acid transferase [Bacteroidales bacterium]|nr:3-deoxy-D-manno-octulosonic acid transferase [Bacteroidales bacterium]